MTERQALIAIENISESYYGRTKDKWWLKLAIYVEKRLQKDDQIGYRHIRILTRVCYLHGYVGNCESDIYIGDGE